MIDLASCPDFTLADIEVRPSVCEVRGPSGVQSIEPRVMQVLVALAQADGRVVSRAELLERCWGGLSVGNDAVSRATSRIRSLARDVAATSFRLETVNKVGYRLVELDYSDGPAPQAGSTVITTPKDGPRHQTPRPMLRRTIAACLVMALLVVGLMAALKAGALRTKPFNGARPAAIESPSAIVEHDLRARGASALFEGTPDQTAQGVAYTRQATLANPGDASAWGSLAMAYVLSLQVTPASGQAAVVSQAREAAGKALRLDPHDGHALAALTSLEPTFRAWRRKDQDLQRAMAIASPDDPPLLFQRVQFLTYVGRTREALEITERLTVLHPLVPWIQAARINLLVANSRLDDAQRAADHAGQVWPRDRQIWFARFYLAAFNGKPHSALDIAADKADWPLQTRPEEIALASSVARAMASRSRSQADHVLTAYRRLAPRGQGYAETAIGVAAALGRPDEAMKFARNLYLSATPTGPRGVLIPQIGYTSPDERVTTALFMPPADAIWSRPESMDLASEVGLIDYWRSTRPPDFCSESASTQLCRHWGLHARGAAPG